MAPIVLRNCLLVVSAVLGLAACGGPSAPKATQAAAQVNDAEITVHQINQALQQQRNLKPEQLEGASRQALERLIDQELALQQAQALKLDREPAVVAQLEAVRREVIARAYAERVASQVPAPTADEVRRYFSDNPALFSDRRIYQLQDIVIQLGDRPASEVMAQAPRAADALIAYLQEKGIPYTVNNLVQAAEAVPIGLVAGLAQLRDGQALMQQQPGVIKALYVVASKPAPVTEAQARPAIEQFLLNERKRKAVEDDLKARRAAAKVAYLGKFAEAAASAPGPAPAAFPAGTKPAEATRTPPDAPAPAASGLDDATLKKGLGIK